MALGTPLSELRRQLRAEVGQSLNVAQGVNAQGQYDLMLARQQQELWEQYEWSHLEMRVELVLSAGQEVYPYPAMMPFNAINKAWCWDGTTGSSPSPVEYQIPMGVLGATGRGWPVQNWANRVVVSGGKVNPAGALCVWPVPQKAGVLVLVGQAPTNPLINDTDVAVLDDKLIVLFSAAEILAQQKSEGATLKLQKANQYLRRLLANQGGDKRRIRVLGGAQMVEAAHTPVYSSTQRFRVPPTT